MIIGEGNLWFDVILTVLTVNAWIAVILRMVVKGKSFIYILKFAGWSILSSRYVYSLLVYHDIYISWSASCGILLLAMAEAILVTQELKDELRNERQTTWKHQKQTDVGWLPGHAGRVP